LSNPADLLAQRLALLDPAQAAAVQAAWRERGDDATVERVADGLAAQWQTPAALPPAADAPGWDATREAYLQHGLDRLLQLCHPDVGGDDVGRLGQAAAVTLRERYVRHGWWHRSEGVLLLPRRMTPDGMRYGPGGPGPLAYTCAVLGDAVQMVQLVRVPQEHEADDAGAPPLGVEECAVGPLVGAERLALDFQQADGGRWTYGPQLDDDAIDAALLERLLDRADAAGVALLALPEYCCSPQVRERWGALLRARPTEQVRWVLVGSGPDGEPGDENVATLMSHDAGVVVSQGKAQPFDLRPGALDAWGCPNVPPQARRESIRERVRPRASWSVLECNRGRLAMAICESIRPQLSATLVAALGSALPTLLLCPIFGKPSDTSHWERPASEFWADQGVQVLIANSFVVADWQAAAAGGSSPAEIVCAAVRRLDDSSKGHGWKTFPVSSGRADGISDAVVRTR
jgi:predicted amidohydrolase